MSLTSNLLSKAKPVSESYSTFFGCTPNNDVFNNFQLDFLYPPNDNAILLTNYNFARFVFGANFEGTYLSEANGSGEKYSRYVSAVSAKLDSFDESIFSDFFDQNAAETPSNVLNMYQENIRTALNSSSLEYDDTSIQSIKIIPEFFISYLELSNENKVLDSSGEEVLNLSDPINTKEQFESKLAVQGFADYISKILKFKFVPHEYIGKVCESIVSFISSTPSYFQQFSYYNEDGLNPKNIADYYNYVVNDVEPEDEDLLKELQSIGKDECFRKVMNFIFPTERLESYVRGDTRRLGFFTIIQNKAYFKLPILSQEVSSGEEPEFSFSVNKKLLTFDFKTQGVFSNALIPYVYDKNRMNLQQNSVFKLSDNEDTVIFKSKPDAFDFYFPDLEIVNSSFEKYEIILSLVDGVRGESGSINFGIEEHKFPIISLPHKSHEEFLAGKVSETFIPGSESFVDALVRFKKLPENHYSFENGNYRSNYENTYQEKNNQSLPLKFTNASYMKSLTDSYVIPKQEYFDFKDELSIMSFPFSKYASNKDTVEFMINRPILEDKLPEKYKSRISVIAKAYLVDNFNQYFPILREISGDFGVSYTNVYEFYLQNPRIKTLEISFQDDSFEVRIEGEDLALARTLVMEYDDEVFEIELQPGNVLLNGSGVTVSEETPFDIFISGSEGFYGEVKFRVRVDDRNYFEDSDIVEITSSFYPNFYSNYFFKSISLNDDGNSAEDVVTLDQEDFSIGVGIRR